MKDAFFLEVANLMFYICALGATLAEEDYEICTAIWTGHVHGLRSYRFSPRRRGLALAGLEVDHQFHLFGNLVYRPSWVTAELQKHSDSVGTSRPSWLWI